MLLTRHSVEILLDLVEIKVNALEIQDQDDAREHNKLKKCRQELLSLYAQLLPKNKQKLVAPPSFQEETFERRVTPRR